MADVKSGSEGAARGSFKQRTVERVARAVAGDHLEQLETRIRDLEAEVQECRRLNLRLAELTDLLQEVLLPVAQRDDEALAAALEKYTRAL